jgi:hypothetical protein
MTMATDTYIGYIDQMVKNGEQFQINQISSMSHSL